MSPIDKNHDQEAGEMKRKLWSVLGVVLMMVFTLMACSSSDETPLSSKKTIDTYSLAGVAGSIDQTGKTIAVTVPYGTNLTALVATFTTTGKKVKVGSTVQESATTANNFTLPVDYQVTAANGSSVTYKVSVTPGPSSEKAILTYSLAGVAGSINPTGKTIAVAVPACTNVTALVATFTTSTGAIVKIGSTAQTSGTTANNFSSPVEYTVTALDASTQKYTVTVTVAAGGCWTKKTDFYSARSGAVGFSILTKGYIGTGLNGATYYQDFWMFDPAGASGLGTWTQVANFGATTPTGTGIVRAFAVGFSIGTKGYVGTGYDGAFKQDFWEYDPAANIWKAMTPFPGTARRGAVGFSLGTTSATTKGYVGTGEDATAFTKDFYELDPAGGALGTWKKMTDFPGTARKNAVGFLIGTKGYVGTGQDSSGYKKDFYQFDPAGATLGTWTIMTDFPGEARSSAIGFGSLCGNGYVGTGSTLCARFDDFYELNPSIATGATPGKWTQLTAFGGGLRDSAVGFMIGSLGYVGTGYDGSKLYADFWQYTP